MIDPDVGRLIRIRSSIRGALEATSSEGTTGAVGMIEAYVTLRSGLYEALEGPLRNEMQAMFPKMRATSTGDLLEDANLRAAARTRLGQLAGWIDGVIEATDRQTQARSERPESADPQS